MTHSIQHSAGNRVRTYTVPILSVRSLFLATAIASGIAYLVCVLFLTVAPQAIMAFFSYVLHANLSGIIRSVTWGSFIVGLFIWSVGTDRFVCSFRCSPLQQAFGEIENNSLLAVFLGLGTVIIFDQVFPLQS